MVSPSQNNIKEEQLSRWILLVMHDYIGDNDRVLHLKQGDLLELVGNGATLGDGWLLGKHLRSGEIGQFPRFCTMIIPRPKIDDPTRLVQQSEALHRVSLASHLSSNRPSDSPLCGICLDDLVNAYALPCGDVFCERCISRWLEDSMTCPLDRQTVPVEVKEDLDNSLASPIPYTNSIGDSNGSESGIQVASNIESRGCVSATGDVDQTNRDSPSSPVPRAARAGQDRPTISWPLERRHGVVRHMASGVPMDRENESFWRQMVQLGRLSQERRQPIRQPGAVVAVRG